MRIAKVSGCTNGQCNPEGGESILVELEHVYAWDPKPVISVLGATCPEHCGGQAGTAACTLLSYDWAGTKRAECQLPAGAAGSSLDVVVSVGDKEDDWLGRLTYKGCLVGQAPDPEAGDACTACLAGKYSDKGVACAPCEDGHFSKAGATACVACGAGTFMSPAAADPSVCAACVAGKYSGVGASDCNECLEGTYSRAGEAKCTLCPETEGVRCTRGILTPQDDFWSPDVLLDEPATAFAFGTELFRCTKKNTCFANDVQARNGTGGDDEDVRPATAFRCQDHHQSVLCLRCEAGYFMRNDQCTACTNSGLSATATTLIVMTGVTCVTVAFLLFVLRKNAQRVNRRLLLERSELEDRRSALAERTARAREELARLTGIHTEGDSPRRRKKSLMRVSVSASSMMSAKGLNHKLQHAVVKMRMLSVDAAQQMVKAAEGGDVVGETPRIVIGFGQVMHHLVRKTMSSSVLVFIELR